MISQENTDLKVQPRNLRVQPLRHPARWVGAAAVVLVTFVAIYSMVTNPNFEWDVVGRYLVSSSILQGVLNTINLTVVSMVIGTLLGTLLAVCRLSRNPITSGAVGAYVWLFRATPLLVQLLFWYNLGALYPKFALGIPGADPFFSVSANDVISGWTAALLGLALHQAAYTAEIVRAGIVSVDTGQREAATALGMPPLLTLRRVILPQAMRAIIPPMGNEVISMMKTTSLVSVIAVPDLLNAAQTVYARTYQTIPLLIVATFWYLVMTAILTVLQGLLERRFGRGNVRTPKSSLLQWIQMRAGSNTTIAAARTEQNQ